MNVGVIRFVSVDSLLDLIRPSYLRCSSVFERWISLSESSLFLYIITVLECPIVFALFKLLSFTSLNFSLSQRVIFFLLHLAIILKLSLPSSYLSNSIRSRGDSGRQKLASSAHSYSAYPMRKKWYELLLTYKNQRVPKRKILASRMM